MGEHSRRRFFTTAAGLAVVGSIAGCTENGDGDDDSAPDESGTDDASSDGSGTDTGGSGAGLDLQEANVVGVTFEGSNRGYEFDVTLHHDDDGEDGYANWWQVERLDGSRLGRRELGHPHSQQPFTRSETIEIPEEVDCVVVRGHDQTHGYGGRAMVVSLVSGERRAVEQGTDRQSIDDCP